jgi:uncharacterized integral membrane protein
LVGLLWLAVVAIMAWLKIPAFALPKWRGWPIPTLLALGGAAAGLLIAFLGRRFAMVGGRRRAGKTRKELRRAVETVIDTRVISPLDTELASLANLGTLVRKLA